MRVIKYLCIVVILAACAKNQKPIAKETIEQAETIERTEMPVPVKKEIQQTKESPVSAPVESKEEEMYSDLPEGAAYAAVQIKHGSDDLGEIIIQFYKEQSPLTVENFIQLAKGEKEFTDSSTGEKISRPFYDGLIFHRIIDNFMIQGGDPTGTGMGGPGYRFADEIHPDLKFDEPGLLAMANAGPNTNGSQFFITVVPTPWLNGRHTIFGKVIKGYEEIIQKLSKVETASRDLPVQPVIMEKVTIIEK